MKSPRQIIPEYWEYTKVVFYSFFYNHHFSFNYAGDVLIDPIIWIVDNCVPVLGPIFVVTVTLIMISVIAICYYIGLPYWWERSPTATICLLIVGNWLKINTIFHYYMGVVTPAGCPPKGILITEAVSICKKCISPKPPRTHHCSICNRCILKMDHHCPWLNNCVGHYNHRYFFMYMVFISLSTLFIMIFGFQLAYEELWEHIEEEWEEITGYPVMFNNSHIIPSIHENYTQADMDVEELEENDEYYESDNFVSEVRKKCILIVAFLISGGFVAITWMVTTHARNITLGETTIESIINKSEIARFKKMNKVYKNPYDFGCKENWKIFFGITEKRSWLCVIFPSPHPPIGDGLTWDSVHYDSRGDDKKNP